MELRTCYMNKRPCVAFLPLGSVLRSRQEDSGLAWVSDKVDGWSCYGMGEGEDRMLWDSRLGSVCCWLCGLGQGSQFLRASVAAAMLILEIITILSCKRLPASLPVDVLLDNVHHWWLLFPPLLEHVHS